MDIDEIERQVSADRSVIPSSSTTTESGEIENTDTEQQISLTRFELFKNLVDVILTEREELDEGLGMHGAKDLTIPFKIAFNTLLINNIIKTL